MYSVVGGSFCQRWRMPGGDFSMARVLFRILVGWVLLTSLLAVSFATGAEECEPVGTVDATYKNCECKGVVLEPADAIVLVNGVVKYILEGYCRCPDHPELEVCWAGVIDEEGNMKGVYFVLPNGPAGTWKGTWNEDTGEAEASVFPGGETAKGIINLNSQSSKKEVEESCACSLFLRRRFRRFKFYDLPDDLIYHTAPPPEKPSEIDIHQVVQEQGSVWINIEPYGLIPSSPKGSLRYQIYFDIDLNPATGIPIREDLGAEFTVWIGFDAPFAPGPQWAAALFRENDAGGFDLVMLLPDEDWDIEASGIRVRIPLSEMGNVVALHWLCLAAAGDAADWVANEGVGFWFDTGAL